MLSVATVKYNAICKLTHTARYNTTSAVYCVTVCKRKIGLHHTNIISGSLEVVHYFREPLLCYLVVVLSTFYGAVIGFTQLDNTLALV